MVSFQINWLRGDQDCTVFNDLFYCIATNGGLFLMIALIA